MIKNGDLPATAIEFNGFGLYAPESHLGLTKREQFAMAAMQGMLSNGEGYDGYADLLAQYAVINADALLAELEKSK